MKLYYAPGACSLSPHIALHEAGLPFEAVRVNLDTHRTAAGEDFREINPLGYVPALVLDDGTVLTEGPAIVQYIADQVPHLHLAPPAGSRARYELIKWLNFTAAELHQGFGALFAGKMPDAQRAALIERLSSRLSHVASHLTGKPWLVGDDPSVADFYLFVVLSWAPYVKFDLAPWPVLSAFSARVAGRPAVQAALKAEGLI